MNEGEQMSQSSPGALQSRWDEAPGRSVFRVHSSQGFHQTLGQPDMASRDRSARTLGPGTIEGQCEKH